MATKVKILSYPGNQSVKKALVAAKFGNTVEIEYDSTFQMGVTNKTPEFLKLNPAGKVPVAITPEGPLFESNAIARYVARKSDKSLLGNNDYESSVVDMWIEFSNNEINPCLFGVLGHVFNFKKYDTKEQFDEGFEKAKKVLGYLESALTNVNHKFLAADRVTLADIIVVIPLALAYEKAFGKDFTATLPKLTSYVEAVLSISQFQGIQGFSICEKTASF